MHCPLPPPYFIISVHLTSIHYQLHSSSTLLPLSSHPYPRIFLSFLYFNFNSVTHSLLSLHLSSTFISSYFHTSSSPSTSRPPPAHPISMLLSLPPSVSFPVFPRLHLLLSFHPFLHFYVSFHLFSLVSLYLSVTVAVPISVSVSPYLPVCFPLISSSVSFNVFLSVSFYLFLLVPPSCPTPSIFHQSSTSLSPSATPSLHPPYVQVPPSSPPPRTVPPKLTPDKKLQNSDIIFLFKFLGHFP